MSVHHLSWVLRNERETSGATRLVLIVLADRAADDGTSYPGIDRIAAEAGIARRGTVRTAISRLIELGLVERVVNGAYDERIPKDRRPNLYRLTFDPFSDDRPTGVRETSPRGGTKNVPPDTHGGTKNAPRGGTKNVPTGVRKTSPKPSEEPPEEPPSLSLTLTDASSKASGAAPPAEIDLDAEFEAFWKRYPRRVGKGHAQRAFRTARRVASMEAIFAGVDRYASEVAGSELRFVAHPSSWLSAHRWEDEPGANLRREQRRTARTPDRNVESGVIDL